VSERPDPRDRPPDPAGTQPKVDLESLLPEHVDAIDAEAFEERPPQLGPGEGMALVPGAPEPAGGVVAASVPRDTKHTPRFQFLFGALLAVGAVALAAAVAIALRPEPQTIDPAAGWSPWRPGSSTPITQIADHVSREYRLPNGHQLVLVTPAPLAFLGIPAQIALEEPIEQGGNISLLQGNGLIYRMCGLGSECSIHEGKASARRLLLLRREALELALYTFRYIDAVDQVVVFLPPAPGKKGATLLFQRDQLGPQLLRPLHASLAHRTPSVTGVESSPDASLVSRLTTDLYASSLTPGNSDPGGIFLVLRPMSEATSSGGSSSSGSGGSDLSDLSQALGGP